MRLTKYWMLIASLVLVACSDGEGNSDNTQTQVAKKGANCQIIFGWEPRQPYQFFENQQVQGIDVDILKQAIANTGCQLNYVEKSWSELLVAVEKGEIDILAGATPTVERSVYAEFSTPYRNESFSLFMASNNNFSGDQLTQFLSFGNKVGVASGYFYGPEVNELMEHPQYNELFKARKSNQMSFYNLQNGLIDGVLSDPIEGRYLIKRKGWLSQMKQSPVNIPGDSVAYMFSKKSTKQEQFSKIKQNLTKMVEDNKIDTLIKQY